MKHSEVRFHFEGFFFSRVVVCFWCYWEKFLLPFQNEDGVNDFEHCFVTDRKSVV